MFGSLIYFPKLELVASYTAKISDSAIAPQAAPSLPILFYGVLMLSDKLVAESGVTPHIASFDAEVMSLLSVFRLVPANWLRNLGIAPSLPSL